MKKIYVGSVIAGVALLLSVTGTPSQAVTTQGDVQANILSALSFTKGDTLDFGSIMSGSASSVIRIAPITGARTLVSGNATLVTGGSENDGTFDLDGVGGLSVLIDVPVSTLVTSGGNNMTVSNFSWSYDASTPLAADGPAALSLLGSLPLSIGADLAVGANQASGVYTGTYSVTVNYQ